MTEADAPLNNAGLSFTPTNGSFSIIVTNSKTGTSTTTNMPVNLLGTGTATTLNSLAAAINNISGLQAQVTGGKLTISSTGANTTFSFGTDTSGTLAALGINTFFTGSNADNLAVNNALVQDPTKFAASSGGVGATRTTPRRWPTSLRSRWPRKTGRRSRTCTTTSPPASPTARPTPRRRQRRRLSAIDLVQPGNGCQRRKPRHEVVDMLQYQESYQASARYISTLSNLLHMLTQI